MKTKINKQVFIKIAVISAIIAAVFGVLNVVSTLVVLLSCVVAPLACLAWFVIPVIAGFFAAKEHNVNKELIVDGMVLGGLGGLVSGVVYAVITSVFSTVSLLLNLGQSASYLNECIIFGTCIYVVAYTVIGGLTGLLYAAIKDTKAAAK
jgi:hypothetical protein